MASFRYGYSHETNPPAPLVLLNLTHPVTGVRAENLSALVDTGADQTVVPERIVEQLELLKLDEEVVQGFDGTPQVLGTYSVILQVRDLAPSEVEVIASSRVPYAVVGRDVLNKFRLLLDGPNGKLEISAD